MDSIEIHLDLNQKEYAMLYMVNYLRIHLTLFVVNGLRKLNNVEKNLINLSIILYYAFSLNIYAC